MGIRASQASRMSSLKWMREMRWQRKRNGKAQKIVKIIGMMSKEMSVGQVEARLIGTKDGERVSRKDILTHIQETFTVKRRRRQARQRKAKVLHLRKTGDVSKDCQEP